MRRPRLRNPIKWLVPPVLAMCSPNLALAKPFKGAEVYSTQTTTYGRMEMRMKMARGSGILSTFFTYKNGSEASNTFWEEIDIEVFGKDDAVAWQSNIITGQGTRTTSEEVHTHPFSLANGYHTYALEWTPDHVAWEIDGVVVRESTGAQVDDLSNPQSLRFNIWAASDPGWVGPFDNGSLPQYQFVNWISYSRYENGQFVLEWKDEFDAWDGSRWQRADWTFAENLVDFDPNNAVVQNGTLVLALTAEGQTGFKGTVTLDDGTTEAGPSGSDGAGGTPSSGGASTSGGAASGGASASGGDASGEVSTSAGGTTATDGQGSGGDVAAQGTGGEQFDNTDGGTPAGGAPSLAHDGCSIRAGSVHRGSSALWGLVSLMAAAFARTIRKKETT